MNILLEFSRSGLPSNEKFIVKIRDYILKNGHKLTRDLLTETKQSDSDLPEEIFNVVSKAISESQAIVIEASEMSLSLGYVLTQSLSLGKPVLFLRYKNANLKRGRFAETIKSKLLTSIIYKNEEDLAENLENFLNQNKYIKTRFNLVIPNELDSYIIRASRSRKISKTEYIINLIKADMEQSKSN